MMIFFIFFFYYSLDYGNDFSLASTANDSNGIAHVRSVRAAEGGGWREKGIAAGYCKPGGKWRVKGFCGGGHKGHTGEVQFCTYNT
jgi:hypothetical protein